jgi:hypothetical protein
MPVFACYAFGVFLDFNKSAALGLPWIVIVFQQKAAEHNKIRLDFGFCEGLNINSESGKLC